MCSLFLEGSIYEGYLGTGLEEAKQIQMQKLQVLNAAPPYE